MCLATGQTPKCHFVLGLPNGSPEIPKIETLVILGAHNFVWKIANLTPDPSFGHNLCFKCPNGSREPILNINDPRAFQWYKELLNTMGFDPYNYSLKIRECIGTLTPKVGVHLGVWRFIPLHFPTLLGAWDVIPGLLSWLAPLQALALVANPRLGLWQWVWCVL
jgi:hypothetical protein